MEPIRILSEYIAPWALPKEEMPIHLVWDSPFPCDIIRIDLPSGVVVKEYFNVEDYRKQNSSIEILRLKTPNFFGFVVASEKVYEEQHAKKQIVVQFLSEGRQVFSRTFTANIYRPRLSLVESPKIVTITEKSKLQDLMNITLKISGFGRIQIRTEASTGGEFVERAEPLYQEMVRRMTSTFKLGETAEDKEMGIKIDPLYLQRKAQEYIERIEKGQFPLDIDKQDLDDFRQWVMDKDNRDKVMDLLSKQIESLIVDSLLFYFDRYPTDNVQLAQGKPVMLIERATQQLRIRFRYRDAAFNEYEPVEVAMQIDDRRENKREPLELPINITWTEDVISPIEEEGEV